MTAPTTSTVWRLEPSGSLGIRGTAYLKVWAFGVDLKQDCGKGISQKSCRTHPFGVRKGRDHVWVVPRSAFAVSKRRISVLPTWFSKDGEGPKSEPRVEPLLQKKRVLSVSAVAQPELGTDPADSSINTEQQGNANLSSARLIDRADSDASRNIL
jgi:hypothetical protein